MQITIGKHALTALLDTGASHSFIREDLAPKPLRPTPHRASRIASTEASLPVTGTTKVTFAINGTSHQANMLVSPSLNADVILGCDWLVRENAVCDFRRGCVYYGTQERTTTYWLSRPAEETTATDWADLRHGFAGPHADRFKRLLSEFEELFNPAAPMTTTPATRHEIRLTDPRPVSVRPYRLSPEKKRLLMSQVQEMLRDGVIEPSTSPYSSPAILVRKKDGQHRFCVDFRRVNAITESLPTSLPVIAEALRDIGTAKVFSTIDLKSGYWQVPMADESKAITAFSTPDGSAYQFRVMPFGLKNAPGTFQRMMTQEVLTGYLRMFVLVYLDDIVVYSSTPEEHLYHLRLVFERLAQYGLRCSLKKCRFGETSLRYLGFLLDEEGNQPDPQYMRKLIEAIRPTNRKQLRRFLGVCNWVREYIPNFAKISAPLSHLTSTKRTFTWSKDAQAAFDAIKAACSKPLRLHRPDFALPFTLQTDASGIGVAAVLYQKVNGERRVISYASAALDETQKKYHANELECFAIVWAVKKYRPYLEDRRFTLRTDNRALTWLHQMKDQRAKLTRWSLLLQEMDFQVEHCPGTENELADALSRQPAPTPAKDPWSTDKLLPPSLQYHEITTLTDEVKQAQLGNRGFQDFVRRWDRLRRTGPEQPGDEAFIRFYELDNGILYRHLEHGRRMYAPVEVYPRILHDYHDAEHAAHPGAEETLRAIGEVFYWPDMETTVREYVRACLICCCVKRGPRQAAAPQRPRRPVRPFDTVSVDIMGPYPRTPRGNRFILVAEDVFSRWTEARPVAVANALALERFLEEDVFRRFSYPRSVITDNGPQFRGARWRRACRRWQVQHFTTPVYHPQANPVERRNQELKKGLRAQLFRRDPTQWDLHISSVLFALRTRKNAATGLTPSQALLGYTVGRPGEWDTEAAQLPTDNQGAAREERTARIRAHQELYARRYRGEGQPPAYQPGDLVLTRQHVRTPFGPAWEGPHTIMEAAGHTTYWVDKEGRPTKVHVDDLRPAPRRPAQPLPPDEDDGDET